MEPALRGVLEKCIDQNLSEAVLKVKVEVYKISKDIGLIDSLKSAVFGDFIAQMMSLMSTYYFSQNQIIPKEAALEFKKMIEGRTVQINSRIIEAVNR